MIMLSVLSIHNQSIHNYDVKIVLKPNESQTVQLAFPKFYDSGTTSENIVFNSVRVLPEYTGLTENLENELANAIDKFSMNIPIE